MKKKALLLVICLGVLLALAGCKKNKASDKDTEEPKVTEGANKDNDTQTEDDKNGADTGENVTDDTDDIVDVATDLILENNVNKGDFKVEDIVKLGKYRGVEVKIDRLVVNEEQVEAMLQKAMYEAGETPEQITGRPVQLGDMVNMDFTGYKDNEEFAGGAAEDFDLVIGSGDFIPGFEDKLVGVSIGETVDIDLTFPENYQASDLAGQAVVFKVTINAINKYNVTQDFVTNNTEFDTIDAYKEALRNNLELANQDVMESEKQEKIYNAIIENSEITSIPQSLIDYYRTDFKVQYSRMAQMYGMTLADIKNAYGWDDAAFESMAEDYANAIAEQELLFEAIVKADNIVLTEEEFNDEITSIVEEYGYASNEEFLLEQGEDIMRQNILYQKVWEILLEEAVEI